MRCLNICDRMLEKTSPVFIKYDPKRSHSRFKLKSGNFQKFPKVTIFWATFVKIAYQVTLIQTLNLEDLFYVVTVKLQTIYCSLRT